MADRCDFETLRQGEQMTTTMAPEQQQQQPAKDPMRFHRHYRQGKGEGSPYAGGSSFMERVSEAVASGMGTVAFLIVRSAVILPLGPPNPVITFPGNSLTRLLHRKGFDPAPVILVHLLLS